MATIPVYIKNVVTKYPILKGIISYSVIWPTSSLIQQKLEGKNFDTFDWGRCIKFGLYGGLFVAPTLYGWIRMSSIMWPRTNFRTAIAKTLTEQVTYGPFAVTSFYFIMSLLEMKTMREAASEVSAKFFPTYKTAVCFWPLVGLVNYSLIPERNRVPFLSICSLCWTIFLAYMKHLEHSDEQVDIPMTGLSLVNLKSKN